jgi:AraC-like DNA-binding protein
MEIIIDFLLHSTVFVPLIIAGAIFFNTEKNNIAKKILCINLLNITFLFLGLLLFLKKHYSLYAYILPIHVASLMSLYPGFYFYVLKLTQPDIILKKLYKHFVPILIIIPQAILFYISIKQEHREAFLTQYRYNPNQDNLTLYILYFARIINIIVILIQAPLYTILTSQLLKQHKKQITEIFSNTETFELNSIGIINSIVFLAAIFSMIFYAVNPINAFGNNIVLILPLLLISVSLWALGIIGLRQKMPNYRAIEKESNVQVENKQNLIGVEINAEYTLYNNTTTYFKEHKPYLDPDLRIEMLIYPLNTNRTHLSSAINNGSGSNFNVFVNKYRVEETKTIIQKKKGNIAPKDIYCNVGFGSLRTMERNFKQFEGYSVKEYIQQCLQK